MIGWCTAQIAGRFARFEFKCFAVESAYDGWDGQQGDIPAARFKFPFPDGAFDSVLLASVFTHMPLVEVRNYLAETHRVLSPSGAVLLSVVFSDSGSETVTHDVNFWLSKDDFLAALESAGLQPSLIATPWQPHHFYRCRRLPAAFDP